MQPEIRGEGSDAQAIEDQQRFVLTPRGKLLVRLLEDGWSDEAIDYALRHFSTDWLYD